jgi:hypothetical protein
VFKAAHLILMIRAVDAERAWRTVLLDQIAALRESRYRPPISGGASGVVIKIMFLDPLVASGAAHRGVATMGKRRDPLYPLLLLTIYDYILPLHRLAHPASEICES